MKAEQISVSVVGPPLAPCGPESLIGQRGGCGASSWREAMPGELIGYTCLQCGGKALGQLEFGRPVEIELDLQVEEHADGSATLHFS